MSRILAIGGVEVSHSSIQGLGLFAGRRLRAGEWIRRVNVVREVTLEAPLREELGEREDNISKGTAWPCNCGAARCGGEVAGDFFRLSKERQQEYRSILADWLVTQHREDIAEV